MSWRGERERVSRSPDCVYISGDERNVRYVSPVVSPQVLVGADQPGEDGATKQEVLTGILTPQSRGSVHSSPVVLVNGCPCDLKDACQHSCCEEALRATHRDRVKNTSRTRLMAGQGVANYGAMEHRLPVGSRGFTPQGGEEEEGGSEGSTKPLLGSRRNITVRREGGKD